MTHRASLHWLVTDWSVLLLMPFMEFLSRLPLFLSWPSRRHDKTPEIKKSSKPQTPTSTIIKCCQSTCSPCMRVWKCPVSQSLTQSGAHTHTPYGAAHKHTQTHVSVHRPAHLCRTPPRLQFTASVRFAVRLSYCRGLEFCLLSGWEERGRETDGEEEWVEGGEGGAGWSSAGQSHCVDDLLQLAPQSLSPGLLVPLQSRQDLILVLDDVGVDLV